MYNFIPAALPTNAPPAPTESCLRSTAGPFYRRATTPAGDSATSDSSSPYSRGSPRRHSSYSPQVTSSGDTYHRLPSQYIAEKATRRASRKASMLSRHIAGQHQRPGSATSSSSALVESTATASTSASMAVVEGQEQDPRDCYEAVYEDMLTGRRWSKMVPIQEVVTTARYKLYRNRQRKDIGEDGQPVWSDEQENAFREAVRSVPPVLFKKKVKVVEKNGKVRQCGRNELIARKIFLLTGVQRKRKQISSHIQVIRNFNSAFNKQYYPTDKNVREVASEKTWIWDDENGVLICTNDPHATSYQQRSLLQDDREPISPTTPFFMASAPVVKNIEFSMSLYSQSNAGGSDHYYRYTQIHEPLGLESINLEDLEDWRIYFPKLSQTLSASHSVRQPEIILLDSALDVREESPPNQSILGVALSAGIRCSAQLRDWNVATNIYEDHGNRQAAAFHKEMLATERVFGETTKLCELPLGSGWWVNMLYSIMKRYLGKRREAENILSKKEHGECNCHGCSDLSLRAEQLLNEERERSSRYLYNLSATQEISAVETDSAGQESLRTVAIFLWRFHRAQPNETATTSWHRVTLPPQRARINSPRTTYPQTSMTLNERLLCGSKSTNRQPSTVSSSSRAGNEAGNFQMSLSHGWFPSQTTKRERRDLARESFGLLANSPLKSQSSVQYSHTLLANQDAVWDPEIEALFPHVQAGPITPSEGTSNHPKPCDYFSDPGTFGFQDSDTHFGNFDVLENQMALERQISQASQESRGNHNSDGYAENEAGSVQSGFNSCVLSHSHEALKAGEPNFNVWDDASNLFSPNNFRYHNAVFSLEEKNRVGSLSGSSTTTSNSISTSATSLSDHSVIPSPQDGAIAPFFPNTCSTSPSYVATCASSFPATSNYCQAPVRAYLNPPNHFNTGSAFGAFVESPADASSLQYLGFANNASFEQAFAQMPKSSEEQPSSCCNAVQEVDDSHIEEHKKLPTNETQEYRNAGRGNGPERVTARSAPLFNGSEQDSGMETLWDERREESRESGASTDMEVCG